MVDADGKLVGIFSRREALGQKPRPVVLVDHVELLVEHVGAFLEPFFLLSIVAPVLLELGVELSEVRPKLGQKRARFHPFRSSNASLHAKALVIDQKIVFIGSMNMDARSAHTNSELGLVMRSAEIARQVTSLLDDISADGSYKLQLADHSKRVEWTGGEAGSEKIWFTDPETTRAQRFMMKILAPFAPEELL